MSNSKENITLPEKPSEELAEETGLHIGDGTMNFYMNRGKILGSYALRGHIVDDRRHYDTVIKKLYFRLYGLKLSLREMPNDGVYGFQKWSNDLVNFKNKVLKLTLGKKIDIKIPEVFTNNNQLITSVIRGIFDTDGMIYLEPKYGRLYPRIEISTISKDLGFQINCLLQNIGFRSTIYMENKRKQNNNWKDIYKLSVRGDNMLKKWMNVIEPHNPKHISKFNYYLGNS